MDENSDTPVEYLLSLIKQLFRRQRESSFVELVELLVANYPDTAEARAALEMRGLYRSAGRKQRIDVSPFSKRFLPMAAGTQNIELRIHPVSFGLQPDFEEERGRIAAQFRTFARPEIDVVFWTSSHWDEWLGCLFAMSVIGPLAPGEMRLAQFPVAERAVPGAVENALRQSLSIDPERLQDVIQLWNNVESCNPPDLLAVVPQATWMSVPDAGHLRMLFPTKTRKGFHPCEVDQAILRTLAKVAPCTRETFVSCLDFQVANAFGDLTLINRLAVLATQSSAATVRAFGWDDPSIAITEAGRSMLEGQSDPLVLPGIFLPGGTVVYDINDYWYLSASDSQLHRTSL